MIIVRVNKLISCTKVQEAKRWNYQCLYYAQSRRGKKLGIADHIVTWSKPKRRPPGMSKEEFAELPNQVRVREVHLLIRQKGFRPKEIIVVTTLVDPKVYTKAKRAQLVPLAVAGRGGLTPCENYFGHGDVAWQNSRHGT
jgi:hypothetical protein